MQAWWIAALVVLSPSALLAQNGRATRTSRTSRPAVRSVSVQRAGWPARPQPRAAVSKTAARPVVAPTAAARSRGSGQGFGWSGFKHLQTPQRRLDIPPPADEQPPPYANKPGALIRTEGLGYTTRPTNDVRLHAVEAGDKIVQEPDQAISLGGRGVHYGPPDKLPPPSLGTGGAASGRNAITPNPISD